MLGFVWFTKQYQFFEIFYKYMRLRSVLLSFYYRERTFAFDTTVFSKNNSYFDGFWQTEKYFIEIADELRKEITLISPLSIYSQGIKDEIQKVNAVSMHVRRGDLISDPNMASIHGSCSIEYYKKAIIEITNRVSMPHFFIFSDDYEWAVENFKFLKYPYTCINNSADKNYEDLILMSLCKHHIIPNSSFGWWGAWLNPSKDKVVVAPKQWFANAPKNNTRDLLPSNYVIIK